MSEEVVDELGNLRDQLDEVLQEPIIDTDDALEVAILAGLVDRLGGRGGVVDAARKWRDEEGVELIKALWDDFDDGELIAAVEDVLVADADEDDVEEAVLDVDEHITAAIWCNRRGAVKGLARSVEESIKAVPDPFASIADVGLEFARMPGVAADHDLYAFWFAIADSAKWVAN